MDRFRRQIARRRRELGWTQKRLAEYLGVDAMSVSRWERGVANPGPANAERLRQWLAGGGTRIAASAGVDRGFSVAGVAPRGYPAIAELVGIVGEDEALYVLRERALLKRAPSAARFPVDPAIRLAEVDRALREQTELIDRAAISRVDRDGGEERSFSK